MDTYIRVRNGRISIVEKRPGPFDHLTEQIKKLAGEGLRDAQIAERVGLSAGQVYQQRRRHNIEAAWPQGRPKRLRDVLDNAPCGAKP